MILATSLCGKVRLLRTFLYASTNSSMKSALLRILACLLGAPESVLRGTFASFKGWRIPFLSGATACLGCLRKPRGVSPPAHVPAGQVSGDDCHARASATYVPVSA